MVRAIESDDLLTHLGVLTGGREVCIRAPVAVSVADKAPRRSRIRPVAGEDSNRSDARLGEGYWRRRQLPILRSSDIRLLYTATCFAGNDPVSLIRRPATS